MCASIRYRVAAAFLSTNKFVRIRNNGLCDRFGDQLPVHKEGRDLASWIDGKEGILCVPKTLSELMTWWNRLTWRNDRAALFLSGRLGLTI